MANNLISEITGQNDIDPAETREWVEALQAVLEKDGNERAHFLIEQLVAVARHSGFDVPFSANTAYLNTIPVARQAKYPGNQDIEQKIRAYVRWNAMMMVLRANKHTNVGGHIASFASAATLYEVGYNHFWRAPSDQHDGDLIFTQGHLTPGDYARAFLLGRLTDEQMDSFRQEVGGKG
ncbi:MAG: pyruvate dehydrogenase (acetyl-transferring), homodimeric type, partial [Gammaproteobacteria bacterium]